MSTTKLFILIAIISVVVMVILLGFNPFSFGDAYFRPRATPQAPIVAPAAVQIDR